MPLNLPTELLRSFAAIVDSGSMLAATERVFVTQSALSLQMKRLEETLQASLFHRDGRRLTLTPVGHTLLVYARDMLATNDRAVAALSGDVLSGPARVGMVQDFAETLLSGVLAQFAKLNPETQLQIRVGKTPELTDLLKSDRLDILLGMGPEDDPAAVRTDSMNWIGSPDLAEQEVLPVAILEEPCRFREASLAALEAAGRPYRVVMETPSLSVIRAAVASDLAVTCRTPLFSTRLIEGEAAGRLPTLPRVAYVRRSVAEPHPTLARLGELLEAAVLEL
jgi:DNA-binding transcriptional LysR family regulator